MKKIFFLLSIAAILFSCSGRNKNQYTIKGIVKGADSGMVYLQKTDAGTWIKVDSADIKEGKFLFKGSINSPEMWYLTFKGKQLFFPFFLENSDIGLTIFTDSIEKSIVEGSETYDVYKQYLTQSDVLNKKNEALYSDYKKARESKDTMTMKKIDSLSEQNDKNMKKLMVDFAKSHGKSVVAPYLIIRNSWQFELPDLEDVAKSFDTSLKASSYYQSVNSRIDILKKVAIGQPAVDFTMNDSTGNPVALSSLKGKILLVDFWASWCGPCRGENPNVVKAYQGYNKKGFDVLGVSFDSDRSKWLKAVKDDHLTWNHVSDLKRWANKAGKLYGISSIPANVLLDKDQKIIAKNLHGEDLLKKLEELLGPPVTQKSFKKGK